MRYLLLAVFLLLVVGLVGAGMYTPVGQGVVERIFGGSWYGASGVLDTPDDIALAELPIAIEADDVAFVPDLYVLSVDSVEGVGDGYVAFVTLFDTDQRFEMPVRPAVLGDAFTFVEAGSVVYVEVDSILERDSPALPILYPLTITIEQ